MEETQIQDDDIAVYLEDQEYIANTYVLKCITVTMAIYTLVYLLNVLGIFIIEQSLMTSGYIASLIIYLGVYFISKKISLSSEKTKYFILFSIILIFTISGVFLTYHVVLLPILTILYATLYPSKRIMSYVFILTSISTVITVYGGYFLGICDANMTLLTSSSMKSYISPTGQFTLTEINNNPYVNLFLFFALPRCLIYIAFASICNSIYKIVCGSIEKAKLSAALEKAKEEAENASKVKSQFLARMSHEIRTPINAVLGLNEMIIRESQEPETQQYAHDIKSSANTLLSLINEILDSSKIESGKMDIIPDNYELSSLLNDLYNMIIIKAEDKGLQLIFDIDPTLPSEYYGDDIRIRQVIVNLLTNAVKYTQEGTISLTVTGKTEGDTAIIRYSIKDTGIGIKEEDLGKLFTQFQRLEETRNRNIEGTGLGINISVQLLLLMGSELKVESEYGKGSEFYFDITQKIINTKPIGAFRERHLNLENNSENDNSYTAKDARVLVVDDNDINRKVFRNLLKRTMIHIEEADSGKECLSILEHQKFDIIFLDYMMPNMNGVETLHNIKARNLCPDTPIIVLTANAVVGAKEEYLNEGFDNYLSKPIIPNKLDKMILHYLPKELVNEGDITKEETPCENTTSLPKLDEFNFDYAMNILQNEALLFHILKEFYKFLEQLPTKLSGFVDELNQDEALKLYKIEVHALKSTSATVGAMLLSQLARMLEVAAAEQQRERIKVLHPILLEEIEKHKERIKTILPVSETKPEVENMEEILPYLEMLKCSLENEDYQTADIIFAEINKYVYPANIQILVDEIAPDVMNLESEKAITKIDKLKENLEA